MVSALSQLLPGARRALLIRLAITTNATAGRVLEQAGEWRSLGLQRRWNDQESRADLRNIGATANPQ